MTRKETKKTVSITMTKEEASMLSKVLARIAQHTESSSAYIDVTGFGLSKEEETTLLNRGLATL